MGGFFALKKGAELLNEKGGGFLVKKGAEYPSPKKVNLFSYGRIT